MSLRDSQMANNIESCRGRSLRAVQRELSKTQRFPSAWRNSGNNPAPTVGLPHKPLSTALAYADVILPSVSVPSGPCGTLKLPLVTGAADLMLAKAEADGTLMLLKLVGDCAQ
jgi:hypothetical protein